MIKLIATLCTVQLLAIAVLFARVLGLEAALGAQEAVPPPASTTVSRPNPSTGSANEQQLRAIIREELQAALAADPGEAIAAASTTVSNDPAVQQELDYRLSEVEQSLDYYSQLGRISQTEMLRLQSDIAKLRPEDRREMFGRLVRELNNGGIEGRL